MAEFLTAEYSQVLGWQVDVQHIYQLTVPEVVSCLRQILLYRLN